jgi:hypothetical protein
LIHFLFPDSADEEDEEDDQPRKELPLDSTRYLRRFISTDTINHYIFFLKPYASNPPWLNAIVLNHFDRIVKEGLIRVFHEVCFRCTFFFF